VGEATAHIMGGDGFGRALALPDEVQGAFGLAPGESVRVLAQRRRTILLERSGADAGTAFPWDRDLVLLADVRAFPLAELLHLLHASAKSGFLFFEQGELEKSVYLHRGEVVFAASNQAVDRLGECLLRAGVITPSQYREAERRFRPPARIGRVLVERGVLTPRELWNGVKLQVEEIVRSLFSYAGGTVYLWEGEVRPDNVVRLSLPTRRLVAEGLERRNELFRFVALLEDARVRLEAVEGAGDGLQGHERAVFESLRGGETFDAVCRRVELDPLSLARTVQLLRLLGAVRLLRARNGQAAPAPETGAGDEASLRRCVDAHAKLLAELTAPVVAVEGASALRERLARVVEEAGRRHPRILGGLEVGAGGALDPEEILRRALRFPGDREREVRAALGELVSYLEFELLNHPRIEDPESFLDDIEPLRSAL